MVNWKLLPIYCILLLLIVSIPSGHTSMCRNIEPLERMGNIFDTRAVAKEICNPPERWYEGQCRLFVE